MEKKDNISVWGTWVNCFSVEEQKEDACFFGVMEMGFCKSVLEAAGAHSSAPCTWAVSGHFFAPSQGLCIFWKATRDSTRRASNGLLWCPMPNTLPGVSFQGPVDLRLMTGEDSLNMLKGVSLISSLKVWMKKGAAKPIIPNTTDTPLDWVLSVDQVLGKRRVSPG